jgi:hypothetical protein
MQNGQWKLQIGNGCLLETRFTFFVLRVAKCNDNFFFNLLAQYGLSGVKQCIENQKFFHGYLFQGGGPTILLVAVVVESEDSRIWHGFIDCRVLNDINVLHISDLFARLANGDAPACNFIVDGHDSTKGYYLADDIYGSWSTFVKTIPAPKSKK